MTHQTLDNRKMDPNCWFSWENTSNILLYHLKNGSIFAIYHNVDSLKAFCWSFIVNSKVQPGVMHHKPLKRLTNASKC